MSTIFKFLSNICFAVFAILLVWGLAYEPIAKILSAVKIQEIIFSRDIVYYLSVAVLALAGIFRLFNESQLSKFFGGIFMLAAVSYVVYALIVTKMGGTNFFMTILN